jgi:hypothetical protein
LNVIKRDGRKVPFDKNKIKLAVSKAFLEIDGEETPYAKEKAREIANYVESLNKDFDVEEIQDIVVNKLVSFGDTNAFKILFSVKGGDNSKLNGYSVEVYGPGYRASKQKLETYTSASGSKYLAATIEGIRATEFDNNYDIFLLDENGKHVQIPVVNEKGETEMVDCVISYSVQMYVYEVHCLKYHPAEGAESKELKIEPLTAALWNYYHAAEDYIDEFVDHKK